MNWVEAAEAELNRIQRQIDVCVLGQEQPGISKETKKAFKAGLNAANKEFKTCIINLSNEAAQMGWSFGFQSQPTSESNYLKVYAKQVQPCTMEQIA